MVAADSVESCGLLGWKWIARGFPSLEVIAGVGVSCFQRGSGFLLSGCDRGFGERRNCSESGRYPRARWNDPYRVEWTAGDAFPGHRPGLDERALQARKRGKTMQHTVDGWERSPSGPSRCGSDEGLTRLEFLPNIA